MGFKKIFGGILIALVVIGILVIFFTSNMAVDTAQQSAETIKDSVLNSTITDNVKEQSLNIFERLFK